MVLKTWAKFVTIALTLLCCCCIWCLSGEGPWPKLDKFSLLSSRIMVELSLGEKTGGTKLFWLLLLAPTVSRLKSFACLFARFV